MSFRIYTGGLVRYERLWHRLSVTEQEETSGPISVLATQGNWSLFPLCCGHWQSGIFSLMVGNLLVGQLSSLV